jgi:hypothetical protein
VTVPTTTLPQLIQLRHRRNHHRRRVQLEQTITHRPILCSKLRNRPSLIRRSNIKRDTQIVTQPFKPHNRILDTPQTRHQYHRLDVFNPSP